MVGQWHLDLDVTQWEDWLPLAVGGLALLIVLVGCYSLIRRRPRRRHPHQSPIGSAFPGLEDPNERRQAPRRHGNPTTVLISDAAGKAAPTRGVVVDRSAGGLRLTLGGAVEVRTILSVRPAEVTTIMPWIQVEVKSCRPAEAGWEVGCHFLRTPPANVLGLFG
jgi:hypothetical protein